MNATVADIMNGACPVDEPLSICGWVKTRRDSKAGLSFLQISDGSTVAPLQIVIDKTLANYDSEVLKLTAGCSVSVAGILVASQGKGQSYEVQAQTVRVVGWIEDPETYPVSAKRHTVEFLRNVAHLRPRTNIISAATRIRHRLAMAIHRFFDDNGFYWVHTPIITGSDCEGAGEMFRVSTLDMANPPKTASGDIDYSQDFFGKQTHLTVSGQLNVEAYCLAMSKVYTFGPTFRAENSNTRRHLSEFWMVEPEIAFASLQDDVALAEKFLKYIYKDLLDKCDPEITFFNKWIDKQCRSRLETLVNTPFACMEYTEAVEKLQKSKVSFDYPVSWGSDLQSEHERYLTEKLVGKPVVVINYPKKIKAFYMRQNDDNKTVAAMDILAPGIGEIIGGSQREDRLEVLDARLDELGLPKQDFSWYRDLRKYGSAPHAGFGLGFERAIQYATGIDNIRDVIPFPRTPNQADF